MEMEHTHRLDPRHFLSDLRRNERKIAVGLDRPNVRHAFPMILYTDSYPSGGGVEQKRRWAIAVRYALRRHVGWGTRVEMFIRD